MSSYLTTKWTAGVFLLLRCSPLLEMSNQALFFITIVGALTAFFAASVAIVQNDLKKVIAYSTTSQLGYPLGKISGSKSRLYSLYIESVQSNVVKRYYY